MERRGFRNFAPVNVGEELDVKIEAVGEKGDGIAKKKGFVLFVPSTKEGDEVRVRVTRVLKKVGFAEVIGAAQKKEEAPSEETEKKEEDLIPEGKDSENFGEESDVEETEETEEPEESKESENIDE